MKSTRFYDFLKFSHTPSFKMYVVLDTNVIIDRKLETIEFERGFITRSLLSEIKSDELMNYLHLYMYKIEVMEPSEFYIEKVKKLQSERNLLLSDTDIDLVSICLELNDKIKQNNFGKWICKDNLTNEIKCITNDNGMIQCLKAFKQVYDLELREFMFRCASCFSIFHSKLDFCKKCASNMISRVSVQRQGDKVKVFLKKGYVRKPKILKDKYGNVLRSADQKEYLNHIRETESKN